MNTRKEKFEENKVKDKQNENTSDSFNDDDEGKL